MTLESDAKFEEKLKPALGLKNDVTNLVNFNASSGKSKNLHFDGLLLSIAYKASAKKVQKSYLSNFNSSSGKSENLHFDGIFLSKVCSVWAKIIQTSCDVKNDLWF